MQPVFMSCRTEAVRKCQQQFQTAQITVQEKAAGPEGLDASIAAVDRALSACETADRRDEVAQLQTARNSLVKHREMVRQRTAAPKSRKMTPGEIAELVKRGDPGCPRGMAYNLEGTEQTIKCVGLSPIRMNWIRVVEYYTKRGYHVTTTDTPPEVRAEHGAELNVFAFSRRDDPLPPKCMTLYPLPNVPWQEAVARVTGAALPKLKLGSPVTMSDGTLALRVDEGKDRLIIRLGDCE
jgi:hypothetical protein